MLEFIRRRYLAGEIDADKVRSYAPRFITGEEAEKIIQEQEGK